MPTADLKKIVSQVAEVASAKKVKAEELVKLLVFDLDGEEYAVPLVELQSIILIPDITPVPSAPEFIRGIFNLRGQIVVVIDLEKRFGLKRERPVAPKHLIILQKEGNTYGLLVDAVKEILTLPRPQIQPAPSLVSSKIQADYLTGVVVIDPHNTPVPSSKEESRLIILLDFSKILLEKELLQLGQKIQGSLKK